MDIGEYCKLVSEDDHAFQRPLLHIKGDQTSKAGSNMRTKPIYLRGNNVENCAIYIHHVYYGGVNKTRRIQIYFHLKKVHKMGATGSEKTPQQCCYSCFLVE